MQNNTYFNSLLLHFREVFLALSGMYPEIIHFDFSLSLKQLKIIFKAQKSMKRLHTNLNSLVIIFANMSIS